MKVVFDTNVVLDVILSRENAGTSIQLLKKVVVGDLDGWITANTITDIYYVARKAVGDSRAREALRDIMAIFNVLPVDGDVCMDAILLPLHDYEDAVLVCCAVKAKADCIVTRDQELIQTAGELVKIVTPDALIV